VRRSIAAVEISVICALFPFLPSLLPSLYRYLPSFFTTSSYEATCVLTSCNSLSKKRTRSCCASSA